jgi:hypothetical protein
MKRILIAAVALAALNASLFADDQSDHLNRFCNTLAKWRPGTKIRSTKSEIRNKFKIRMTQTVCLQVSLLSLDFHGTVLNI